MGTQQESNVAGSELISPGLFRDASATCYPTKSSASVVAELLRSKGRAFLKVSGRSMFPWFRPGDVVFVRRANFGSLSRGDVVVFERGGRLCMHRVLSFSISRDRGPEGLSVVTKGDAVAEADEPIYPHDFRGKIEFLYRNGKEINFDSIWRKLSGKILAIVSPASRFWLSHFCHMKNHLDEVTAPVKEVHESAELRD